MITVYIWNPKSDADYGHAAMKIKLNGVTRYYSWFPSGDHYNNRPGIPRTTPSSYGSTGSRTTREPVEDAHNYEDQEAYMTRRKSDKEELRRSATFKFYFRHGLNEERAEQYWQTLYASNAEYVVFNFNCCDTVLQALQLAVPDNLKGVSTSRLAARQPEKIGGSILNHYHLKVSHAHGKATKAQTVYKYCLELAKQLNQNRPIVDPFPPVVLRHNDWLGREQGIEKHDYDPLLLDPNPLTRHTKLNSVAAMWEAIRARVPGFDVEE